MKQRRKTIAALLLSLVMLLALIPSAAAERSEKPEEPAAPAYDRASEAADKEEPITVEAVPGTGAQPTAVKPPRGETPASNVYEDDTVDLGYNDFHITNAGDVVYRKFTPAESGMYMFYSNADSYDTIGYFVNGSTTQSDDDGGTDLNFCIFCTNTLIAGQTYWIGAGFYDSSLTGYIDVRAERVAFGGTNLSDVYDGYNSYNWQGSHITFYRYEVPHDGQYLIYTESSGDTWGIVMTDGYELLDVDDDHGAGQNCRMTAYLETGESYWIGVRGYSYGSVISYDTLIEPYDVAGELTVGANSVYVRERTVNYGYFVAPRDGTYRIRSESDEDPYGYLKTAGFAAVTRNDDGAGDLNYCLECDMNAGETYYIGTRFYDPTKSGSIGIRIETDAFDPEIVWNSSDVSFKGTTPYVIANGRAQTPRFTVRDKNDGTTIDPSNYTYSYSENTNAGTGYVIVTFTGAYSGTVRGFFKIYLPATKATAVANTADGITITWDPVDGAAGYVIYRRAWSSTTNGWTTFERWNNTTGLEWTDTNVYPASRYQYGIKAYFARRTDPVTGASIGGNVGDNYNLGMVGPLKTTVRITSRVLKSLNAGSRKITVNWSPSNKFTGYQIKYATNAAFTKDVKSIWVSDPAQSSVEIKSLKNGTQYYVCLRSYHNFEGTQYYGAWSNVLSVKPGSGQTVTCSKYRALVVGETDYSSANDLAGSVNDMHAVAGVLSGLSTKFTCTKLPNATKTQILNGIGTAFAGANDYDVSLFYFAGHGSSSSSSTYRGALCTVEGDCITFAELAAALSKVKGRVIVIISSCFSGSAIAASDGASGETIDPEAYNQEIIDAFSGYYLDGEPAQNGTRSGELRQSKFIVLTAAAKDEVGWEGTWSEINFQNGRYRGHALGTAFIEGMGGTYPDGSYTGSMPADRNKNKQVTLKELYDYVYDRVYNWTKDLVYNGEKSPAHVQYYGPDSEVLFRR